MKPHVTLITLGVTDLQRSLEFYRDGLGLPTKGIVGDEFDGGSVVFFKLDGGLILGLFPRPELLKDAELDAKDSSSHPPQATFSLAHNVGSKEEVDQVMREAAAAGATITSNAHDKAWGGYSGYFQDPDGFLWEVAWNPGGFSD